MPRWTMYLKRNFEGFAATLKKAATFRYRYTCSLASASGTLMSIFFLLR
jgi:hypothetical protein